MAAPKMVDIRNLNPQQLSEVNQRLETELQVLQNCHQELVGGNLYAKIGEFRQNIDLCFFLQSDMAYFTVY